MFSMFGRYDERAHRSITLAQDEVRHLAHTRLGAEHLLLGVLREGIGAGARALKVLGVNLDRLRAEVEKFLPRGTEPVGDATVFSPSAKKVLVERAITAARHRGHNYVGSGHILLALLEDPEDRAASLLRSLGVDPAALRGQIEKELSGGAAEPETR